MFLSSATGELLFFLVPRVLDQLLLYNEYDSYSAKKSPARLTAQEQSSSIELVTKEKEHDKDVTQCYCKRV